MHTEFDEKMNKSKNNDFNLQINLNHYMYFNLH